MEEPGFVAVAAECGQQVVVHSSTTFEVGDHDFRKTPDINGLN